MILTSSQERFEAHAAASERWDNEGGAPSEAREQKRMRRFKNIGVPIGTSGKILDGVAECNRPSACRCALLGCGSVELLVITEWRE
jgi:hypothetical protein